MTEEPGGLPSIGLQKVGRNWNDLAHHTEHTSKQKRMNLWLCQCGSGEEVIPANPGFPEMVCGGLRGNFPVSFAPSCFSHVWFFAILCTIIWQILLSMLFSRQKYWNGLPWLSPGDLPNPGYEPRSLTLQADSLLAESPGKPWLPVFFRSVITPNWKRGFEVILDVTCEVVAVVYL